MKCLAVPQSDNPAEPTSCSSSPSARSMSATRSLTGALSLGGAGPTAPDTCSVVLLAFAGFGALGSAPSLDGAALSACTAIFCRYQCTKFSRDSPYKRERGEGT